MTTPGSKTPVSIINEYFTRRGSPPKFELVLNGCGTHNPTFAYVLECDGVEYKAFGKGRSKQEAKHEAAKEMLLYLNNFREEKCAEVKQLVLPQENSVPYNAVGELMDFCKKECYPDATFHGGGDTGLPHEKMFTFKCCVSQLTTVGEARTKKQAKQIAAHKMLMQLQVEAGEKPLAVAIPKNIASDDIKIQDIGDFGKATSVYKPLALLYKDFCNAYLGLPEKSETLLGIITGELPVGESNSCDLALKISEELGVFFIINEINEDGVCSDLPPNVLSSSATASPAQEEIANKKQRERILFITLNLNPPVVSTGRTFQKLCLNLLENLVQLSS